jgi:site-specific DNA-methyltransferase (adenine-specific)
MSRRFCVKDEKNYTFNSDDILVEARTEQRKLIDYRKPVLTQYNTKKVPGNVWYFPRVRYRMDEYEEHPTLCRLLCLMDHKQALMPGT